MASVRMSLQKCANSKRDVSQTDCSKLCWKLRCDQWRRKVGESGNIIGEGLARPEGPQPEARRAKTRWGSWKGEQAPCPLAGSLGKRCKLLLSGLGAEALPPNGILWSPYVIGRPYIFSSCLWSPYGIGQTIILSSCFFFFFFFFLA